MTAEKFALRSYEFRREREKSWRELEKLIARANSSGIRSLSATELNRLPALYRAAASSLNAATCACQELLVAMILVLCRKTW